MSVYENGGGYGGPQSGGPRPAIVRFDAISEAFNFVKQQAGVWVLSTLIYIGISYAVILPIAFALGLMTGRGRGSSSSPSVGAIGTQLVVQLVVNVIAYALSAFFMAGFYRMALKQIRGGTIAVADLFTGGDAIGPMFLTTLLYGLGVTAGIFLCAAPGVFLAIVWALAPLLVVDQNMAPIDALRISFNALKGQFWPALGFLLVAGLIGGLGVLACGVGMLFTYPVTIVATAILYNDFFGNGTGYAQPTIDMPLPPSNPSL